jgi:hypothetical protein
LVIELGDALLGNPDILDGFDQWRARHSHIKLSDYYDQLEKEFDALEANGAKNRISGD